MKREHKACRGLVCIMFAGGRATRLYPHTIPPHNQKALLVMGNPTRKLMDFSLGVSHGAERTYVITHYLRRRSAHVEKYLATRYPGVQLLRDKRPIAAGTLIDQRRILDNEDSNCNVVILAPDHIHQGLDLAAFHRYHLEHDDNITLLVSRPKEYGEYVLAHDGRANQVLSTYQPNALSTTGTYIIKFRHLTTWVREQEAVGKKGTHISLYRDLVCPTIERQGASVFESPTHSYWDDAGTLLRYHRNNMRLSGGGNVVSDEAMVLDCVSLSRCVVLAGSVLDRKMSVTDSIISGRGRGINITVISPT